MNAVLASSAGWRPAARTILRAGAIVPGAALPMRRIAAHPTAAAPPLIVDDSSWLAPKPAVRIDIGGLPRHRAASVATHSDAEAGEGRAVRRKHNRHHSLGQLTPEFSRRHRTLRTWSGKAATEFAHVRAEIVTPDMELIVPAATVGRWREPRVAARGRSCRSAAICNDILTRDERR